MFQNDLRIWKWNVRVDGPTVSIFGNLGEKDNPPSWTFVIDSDTKRHKSMCCYQYTLYVGLGLGLAPSEQVAQTQLATWRKGPFLDRRQSSAPVLRPVPDMQDFDNFFRATVHG